MATSKKSATKKKTVAKKAAAKKTPVKKTAAKKAPAKPAVAAKKTPTKSTSPKAANTKKVSMKKTPVKPAADQPTAKATSTATSKKPASRPATVPIVDSIEPYQETPGEDYMNEPQREHFRNILKAWKRELMEEVDRTVHHMQDEAANFPDPNDRATQESEFSMELRARDRERKLIKKIDETLIKLDHDEYGYCESCGVEIGVRRLEARPTAALCIDCKTLDEIREKQMGS